MKVFVEGKKPAPLPQPLAEGGGVGFKPAARGDLSDWVELMEVVEALCPVWPSRGRSVGTDFRL